MRNRNEFVQLIDRYRLGQVQRLAIGLTLSPDFSTIDAALVLAEGRGKFIRVRWIENKSFDVPLAVARACQKLSDSNEPSLLEFAQLSLDLTRTMATATNQVATVSGNHARMLMDVCVDDPGLWLTDYDGKRTFQSFCQPSVLAELSGLTVIDALPFRDLAANGRGWPLGPLPAWLLFADRDNRIAEFSRLLINYDQSTELTWLPESDGLDNELPAIRFRRLLGLEFKRKLLDSLGQSELSTDEQSELGSQGKVRTELARTLADYVVQNELDRRATDCGKLDELVATSSTLVQQHRWSIADVLKSLAHHVAFGTKQFLVKLPAYGKVQLVQGGLLANEKLFKNELVATLETPWQLFAEFNFDPKFLRPSLAALHGLMNLDQMPATIPWLTGTDSPRVLGRLTPGSPSNWRRVIMEMGDCRPPVMKLRDAV